MSKSSLNPRGLGNLIPQLVVRNGHAALRFLEQVFDAKVGQVMPGPDGKGLMHGAVTISDSTVFIAEPFGPAAITSANLYVFVPDVDATVAKAKAAGAEIMNPPTDMFWGDRWAVIRDPSGTTWQVATHVEDVSPEEMQRRMAAAPKP
ncbi:MAG: VOC family protein [Nannocystaceae bacterium]|nr:VOC family protein [Nannocystaceae bacterium]